MKLLYLLTLVLLAPNPASAQQLHLDSLYAIWQDPTQADSARAKAYNGYIWKGFLFSNPDTAAILADELIAFGIEQAYPKAQALALGTKGVSYGIRGDYPKALDYFTQCLKIDEQLGDQKGISGSLNNIGLVYKDQGDYSKALDFFTRSLKIDEQLGDQQGIATTLGNIGLIYSAKGDDSKALDYYTRSLKIDEQLGNQQGMSKTLNNIGLIYSDQGDYPKALDYYTRSLKIDEQLGNQQGIAVTLGNIGLIYSGQGDDSKALDYFTRSLKIFEQLGHQQGIANWLNNIGFIYLKQGDNANALRYCQEGYDLALSIGVLLEQKFACECLYGAYKAMGKPQQALEYYEKMIALRDSIDSEENTKRFTQLEMQYEFDKKEAANKAEQDRKDAIAAEALRRQKLLRNGFIGGFALVLFFAGIFLIQRNRIGKEKQRSEELLLNILPEETAKELKEKGHADAQLIDQVTVLFTDFKDFTALSEKVTPQELVASLHECFSAFDLLCQKYGIEKIKTIGDAYMAAGGLPTPNRTNAQDVVNAALEMAQIVEKDKAKKIAAGLPYFEIRIGVHTGPVVAGIVGIKKFQYDIWGDTVNTASRMESSGEPGKVNASQTTYELLKGHENFVFEGRGKIATKGKGEMEMYFVKLS